MVKHKLPVLIIVGTFLAGCFGCSKSQEKQVAGKQASQNQKNPIEYFMGEDGAPMAKIPAGNFVMGSANGDFDERPMHTVYLDAFYIDVYEVSNELYKKFVDATGHKAPKHWNDTKYNAPNQPVVGVTWEDAKVYAQWAGKRLPTEAEWEKAARGGLEREEYPWGYKIDHERANYKGTGLKDRWEGPAPVGSFLSNGYGLYNTAGNVYEWCSDWYDKNYYASSPKKNPRGAASGKYRVLRGGSWSDVPNLLRVADRYFSPSCAEPNIGFRCARDVAP